MFERETPESSAACTTRDARRKRKSPYRRADAVFPNVDCKSPTDSVALNSPNSRPMGLLRISEHKRRIVDGKTDDHRAALIDLCPKIGLRKDPNDCRVVHFVGELLLFVVLKPKPVGTVCVVKEV